MVGGRVAWAAVLLCLLASPAGGQPIVGLSADPASGSAPLDTLLAVDAEPGLEAPWRVFYVVDEQTVQVANGTGLPAQVQAQLDIPGTHVLRLVVEDNGTLLVASTQVEVQAPLASTAALGPLVASDVIPLLVAGAMMLMLAAWLLRHDRRNPINIAFAILFVARGVADITLALWTNSGRLHLQPGGMLDKGTHGAILHLHPVSNIVVMGAAIYFLYVYLAQNRARLAIRHGRFSIALGSVTALLVAAYLAFPSLWWAADGLPGPLIVITGLYYPLYAIFALLLFRESVTDIPDERRRGAFLSGLGFLFLPVFSGAGELIFVDILDYFGRVSPGFDRGALSLGFEVGHFAAVLALVPALAAGYILGRDALRNPDRPGARLHLGLYLLAMLLPLLSLAAAVAVFQGGTVEAARASFRVFAMFQGVWAIPYAVLVAIGITRYQDADRQEAMRRQTRRFTLASIFMFVFFAVSEGVEALAASSSSDHGTVSGLAAAAAMTLLLHPIQQRLQRGILAEPSETAQEVRFYREQVRRTLGDGFIGEVERKFLLNLQETMGLRQETAQRIERDLLQERGLAPA